MVNIDTSIKDAEVFEILSSYDFKYDSKVTLGVVAGFLTASFELLREDLPGILE